MKPAGRSGLGHPPAYLTWQRKLIEGKGVTPSVPVELLPDDLLAEQGPQMQKAIWDCKGDGGWYVFCLANGDAGLMP